MSGGAGRAGVARPRAAATAVAACAGRFLCRRLAETGSEAITDYTLCST